MSSQPPIRLAHLPSLVWEFTESDFSTFVIPNTAFGVLAALAAPALADCVESPGIWPLLVKGAPRILLFNWANLVVFDLANQRLPESVKEDLLNKPWRPLPQGHISPTQARQLLLGAVPAALAVSAALGVGSESAIIMLLIWMYNDLKGGDELTRDPIIAAGYVVFLVSSLQIAIKTTTATTVNISTTGYHWLGIVGGIIVTTMQIQDLKDQVGDRARERKTWPLVIGDRSSRRWIAACVVFWTFTCIFFWSAPPWMAAIPILLGIWTAVGVLRKTGDAQVWRRWCLWQVSLYALPPLCSFFV
ncbi:hypothetical protein PISL3812_02028 [Talaromyces islandicus]|uniref:Digeranylgeranylglyceryl phosphate synthase n=1 Tax=Talaromyces islandicus TaxID=28573 RepID=A0A0U1LNR3_TALIS|nr:hypothetical protein PISL3812_02028 [Talaromyces islandicus]